MRPLAFWSKSDAWQSTLLAPFAWLYAFETTRRLRGAGFKASVPVICVGNINLGGTGKTPTVIALVEFLHRRGQIPHIVTRGYGGKIAGPIQVIESTHTAEQVGDEALLLAAFAPTWVAKDRAAGVKMAEQSGANVIVLDDGFQNPSVVKDLSIIVVDAEAGFGNGRVFPAGPLRETASTGLKRADVLLVIGNSATLETFNSETNLPRINATLAPLQTGMDWQGLRVMAFAGIGRPEKFFQTLQDLGATLAKTVPLDDHQPLSKELLTRLARDAESLNAQLVTTEKDAVRLPSNYRTKVLTLPVRLQLHDWKIFDKAFTKLGL
jgi:tetraacyldisaccharide 4'-kinase